MGGFGLGELLILAVVGGGILWFFTRGKSKNTPVGPTREDEGIAQAKLMLSIERAKEAAEDEKYAAIGRAAVAARDKDK